MLMTRFLKCQFGYIDKKTRGVRPTNEELLDIKKKLLENLKNVIITKSQSYPPPGLIRRSRATVTK